MKRWHEHAPIEASRSFEQWLELIEGDNAVAVERFMSDGDHAERIAWAPGSREAHHAWEGGYAEHLRQTMWIANHNYELLVASGRMAELPSEEQFTLSDALTVLFLHDIEKMYVYDFDEQGRVVKFVDMRVSTNIWLFPTPIPPDKKLQRSVNNRPYEGSFLVLGHMNKTVSKGYSSA